MDKHRSGSSDSLLKDTTCEPSGEDYQCATPLDEIAEAIESSGLNVEETASGLTFASHLGETSISVLPRHISCLDGEQVSEVIHIKTPLPELKGALSKSQIALINTMAGLSALAIDEESGQLFIANRLSVFKGYEDAWRLFVPLVSISALLQADSVYSIIRHVYSQQQQTGEDDIPESKEPSCWGKNEFEQTQAMLENMNLLATTGPEGITAEFPWELGGISAAAGHQTSLMLLRADMPHPVLGNGLFYRLDLPTQFEETDVIDLSNRMNLAELEAADSPPFFGAWCSMIDTGRLSFAGFWPNMLYCPGTAANIASWLGHRSRISRVILSGIQL